MTLNKSELHELVDHNMTNHAPVGDHIVECFEILREAAKTFAHEIVEICPEGREKSLALTNLEQALMWSVAAIARNQEQVEE